MKNIIQQKLDQYRQLKPFTDPSLIQWLNTAFEEVYEAGVYERKLEETRL